MPAPYGQKFQTIRPQLLCLIPLIGEMEALQMGNGGLAADLIYYFYSMPLTDQNEKYYDSIKTISTFLQPNFMLFD